MIKSVEDLNKRLEKIEETLPKLHSNVASEQLEYNGQILKIAEELEGYIKDTEEILNKKIIDLKPTEEDNAINELFVDSEQLRSIIKLLGKDEEFVERFGFDRTIYEIGHATNVDHVNNVIKTFIKDMENIGITLSPNDFKYSTFTYNYMVECFKNLDDERFLFNMKQVFDDIYWECPKLLVHIELCVRNLVLNNKKSIVKHINKLIDKYLKNINIEKDDVIDEYVKVRNNHDELKQCDPYNLYTYFKNNPSELDVYKVPSIQFDSVISSVTDSGTYSRMSDEEKKLFFDNITDLYYELREYELISKYKNIFEFIQKIFNKTDAQKGEFKSKLKEIAKLESGKKKLDAKISRTLKKRNRINGDNKERINQINFDLKTLYNDLDKQVTDIKTALDEATRLKFEEQIKSILVSSSNIYDAACLISKYYGILHNEVARSTGLEEAEVSALVDDFRHIQYNSHLTIMKSVSFLEINTVKELIEKKFNLYNINIELDAIDSGEFELLKKNVDTLVRYNNLSLISLTPDDLKVMVEHTIED